jgi:hypothetical protein
MILILVYIGCILAVAGGLHFMDVKFLKGRVSASAAVVAGLLLAGSAEAALVGSSSSFFKAQQIRTSACELEGETAHPEHRRSDQGRVIDHHIRDCMTSAGYVWASEQQHCKEAPVATNPFCYAPANAFERAVTGFQVTFAFD